MTKKGNKNTLKMLFSASSQWSKICFGYQGIIFNGKKGLKFSQIVLVRLEGGDPPSPHQSGQPDRFFPVFFTPPLTNIIAAPSFYFVLIFSFLQVWPWLASQTRAAWTVKWSPMTAETVQARHLWQFILDKALSHPRQDLWIPDNPDCILHHQRWWRTRGVYSRREIQPAGTQSLKVNPNVGA